jgi:hypothetical protein
MADALGGVLVVEEDDSPMRSAWGFLQRRAWCGIAMQTENPSWPMHKARPLSGRSQHHCEILSRRQWLARQSKPNVMIMIAAKTTGTMLSGSA